MSKPLTPMGQCYLDVLTLFGMGGWADATVKAWFSNVLIPGGGTPDEIRAAAVAVVSDGPPSRPHEIIAAIVREIRRARQAEIHAREASDRRAAESPSGEGCPWCEGTGWVSVPHCHQPDQALEKGYLATHAVSCRCPAGLRMPGHSMTLDQYEVQNPRWLEQLAEARARAKAEWMARGTTTEMDNRLEAILARSRRHH